jgi:hypothetical protein
MLAIKPNYIFIRKFKESKVVGIPMMIDVIKDLTNKVQSNLRTINGNLYLDVYLIDEFFRFVNANWKYIKDPQIAPYYLKLQRIIINDVLLNIIVGGVCGNLYNSMMTYNATCTEENLHYFYKIPYGGDGEVEHLCIHTGFGNGTSDLNAGKLIRLLAKNDCNQVDYVEVGPKLEVKDYKNFSSAQKHFEQDAETSVYHDANHVFIHVLDTNTYYIAENRKTSKWYQLAAEDNIKQYRRQVKLWLDDDGFLGVRFR